MGLHLVVDTVSIGSRRNSIFGLYPKTERFCLSRICFEMTRQVRKTRCQLSWKSGRWTPYISTEESYCTSGIVDKNLLIGPTSSTGQSWFSWCNMQTPRELVCVHMHKSYPTNHDVLYIFKIALWCTSKITVNCTFFPNCCKIAIGIPRNGNVIRPHDHMYSRCILKIYLVGMNYWPVKPAFFWHFIKVKNYAA
jgi:hypothetical protein